MELIRTKARWNNDSRQKMIDLGLEPDESTYNYKEILVNRELITHIEDYEGFCCLNFSALFEDVIITDVPYSKAYVFGQIIN